MAKKTKQEITQLLNYTEYLSKEEYALCIAQDPTFKNDVAVIGQYSDLGEYYNLRTNPNWINYKKPK